MKIVVFGSEKCRYCAQQIGFIKSAFSENDWMYIDVSKGKDLLKIASESKVENIPTTIVFDEDWNPIFRQEGTTSTDQLFSAMYGNKSIPVGTKTASLIRDRKVTSCLLSKKRKVSVGDIADIVDYQNQKIATAKVLSVSKVSPDAAESICHPSMIQEYHATGGRKDWAQLIVFGL